jgi:hypothetical protein
MDRRSAGALRGAGIGLGAGCAVSFAAPLTVWLFIAPGDLLALFGWALPAACMWTCVAVPAGAYIGAVAGAVRPGGYGHIWWLTTWAGASVGVFVGEVALGGNFSEQDAQMRLTGVGGLLVGAFSGLLLGLLLGVLGCRFPSFETDDVAVKRQA